MYVCPSQAIIRNQAFSILSFKNWLSFRLKASAESNRRPKQLKVKIGSNYQYKRVCSFFGFTYFGQRLPLPVQVSYVISEQQTNDIHILHLFD